jgi:hypothetical protein
MPGGQSRGRPGWQTESFRSSVNWADALGSLLTSIDCQCPHKRSSLGFFTDKASGLQRCVHTVRWVNEGPKALACQSQRNVLQSNHDSHVPTVAGIGKS